MAVTTRRGIIGAGNLLVDQLKRIDRWPGEGNLCNILDQSQAAGGGPCNVLFDLAAMTEDIPLFIAGRIGMDEPGNWLLNEIRHRKIDAEWVHRSTLPTSFTDVFSGAGKRTFFHCRGANTEFDLSDLETLDIPAKLFYLGYLLLLDKLDSADPDFGTRGARLLHSLQQKGYRTIVDFVSEAPEKFRRIVRAALPYIDILVINELEAGNTFERTVRRSDGSIDRTELHSCAQAFLASGVKNWVVIHYPEGAYALTASGESCELPSCPVEKIVGTNGAGDAFCAGILYGVHEDLSLFESLQLANASAAFNLRSTSASGGAVSIAQMRAYLEQLA